MGQVVQLATQRQRRAVEFLTDLAIAFDPVEGDVHFAADVWQKIRQMIFDLNAAGGK